MVLVGAPSAHQSPDRKGGVLANPSLTVGALMGARGSGYPSLTLGALMA
jgi:hypothetical protein